MSMAITTWWIEHAKTIEAGTNVDKDGKTLHKLINNAVYGKTMKKLRKKIDGKLVRNEKDYLKLTSKPSYMSQKIFDYDFVEIEKR